MVDGLPRKPDAAGRMRLLIIEDNQGLRQSLTQYMREASFVVDSTGTGDEGLWFASEHPYDAILLDLMLPQIDGMEILRKLRKRGTDTFILVISALDGLDDRLDALNAGADDYLTKPFPMSEALARIHALLRRKYEKRNPILRVADLTLNPVNHSVSRAGEPCDLTALEYRLLEYLAFRSGELVSRTEIWEHVFEDSTGGNSNVADVYIGYLRKKLNAGGLPNLIHTRRGQGFILDAP
jgi:two-component system, OmpR family, copper resistance phosphate regulon response regulator CusR